jgi:circadian clock protein KaiB
MEKIKFKLYITGKTFRSEKAIDTLSNICDLIGENAEMTIIDILEDPEEAEKDKILATPTLLKTYPPGTRRIVGDLYDIDKVIRGLDLTDYISQKSKGEQK